MTSAPDLTAAKAYLGPSAAGFGDDQISAALATETLAQKSVCRVPLDQDENESYPADLAEALLRRVARNLAVRNVPLGVQTTPLGEVLRFSSSDPETRRLEAPYRRVAVA